MSIADFLKDLPSRDKANFSSFLKQSNWGNNPTCSTSSNRSARSERKRASDVSSNTIDESESSSGARVKTRRRE
uniref:DET1- and DDB1-associated protein 1 N-terminal domain-containing protein n=1 Tax=Brugia malayi TaxID=6279 RepID=A0A5S6P9E2_BRUMA